MKCKIDCPSHNKENREWEITPEGRVWPCCYYANAWEKRLSLIGKWEHANGEPLTLVKDKPMWERMKQDPNWNHLDHHSLDEIVEDPILWEHVYYPGWESDDPSYICKENCGEVYDKATNTYYSGSLLEAEAQIKGNNSGGENNE